MLPWLVGLTRRVPSMLKWKNTKSFRIKRQEEDHGLPGVQRAVPVRAAGVEAGVQRACAGDGAVDQPVEDGQHHHRQQPHHCGERMNVFSAF